MLNLHPVAGKKDEVEENMVADDIQGRCHVVDWGGLVHPTFLSESFLN